MGKRVLCLCIYVDNILICAKKIKNQDWLINEILAKYPTKLIGFPSFYLGYTISKNSEGCIFLSQQGYIRKLIKSYNQHDEQSMKTPILMEHIQSETDENASHQLCDPSTCASLIGCLNWVSKSNRSYISFSMTFLARFSAKLNLDHYKMLLHLL
eukprot:Ihof_evm3s322 gene=Ihof_evmTU3s322